VVPAALFVLLTERSWVSKWDEDEGANKSCASNTISESHNSTVQHVIWDIALPPPPDSNGHAANAGGA
jgi:hypothetical protein